jgi:hypothetical protein
MSIFIYSSRARICAYVWIALLAAVTASAQFKVVGPAPYSQPVARQKIRTLLRSVDSTNRRQTTDSLMNLLNWYRDLIDEELIVTWQTQTDRRAELAPIIDALATPRVASGIIEFSWRERDTAFRLDYAPMFEHLLTRYADSGRPMLDGLRSASDLSDPAAEAVCRILIDMPEIGAWRQTALQVLPRYRAVARRILTEDLRSDDRERQDRAGFWLDDPRSTLYSESNPSAAASPRLTSRSRRQIQDRANRTDGPFIRPGPEMDSPPPPPRTSPSATPSTSSRPTLMAASAAPETPAYNGPMSGTLECSGSPIPQNAEYVFRNLPAAKLRLDYDTKIWDARLAPVDGQTQKLILRNRSSGAQKHCSVHWTVTQP